jgi:HSP20 family protein
MAVVRFEPLRELAALQSEMSRFMNQVYGTGGSGGGQGSSSWLPPLDLWETEAEIVLALDLPGVAEHQVSIEVDDGVLTVTGERDRKVEETADRFYRFERRFGQFSRSVTLPPGVDEARITAEFDAGVLEIHVPKPDERKPKRIQIGDQGAIEGDSTPVGA